MDEHKSLGFMVIRNDTILYEWYKEGFDRTSTFTSFSLVKSLVSLMTGIAVEEGKLKVDDPIGKYLPEIKDSAVRGVKVEDLLNMASGIKFKESYFNPFASIARLYYGRKIPKYIKNLKLENKPGTKFSYSSMDTQLLSMVLSKATGMSVSEYMEKKLWSQMDMEFDASWNLDSKKSDTEKGFSNLNARMVDFAKFGKLMMNNGKWGSKQLVPETWLDRCKTGSDLYKGYSYQWWITNWTKDKDYVAQGILGQYLYVNETRNTIVLRFGKNWADVSWVSTFSEISSNPLVLQRKKK